MQYSCGNTEPLNGKRAVKQWERGGEEAQRAA